MSLERKVLNLRYRRYRGQIIMVLGFFLGWLCLVGQTWGDPEELWRELIVDSGVPPEHRATVGVWLTVAFSGLTLWRLARDVKELHKIRKRLLELDGLAAEGDNQRDVTRPKR